MKYEPIIGLEIHAELLTITKMFCGCSADHSSLLEPNTLICPVCTGLPGAMPVLNKKAVEQSILVGLALNCTINEVNIFARKNYFYPDLPKGYQISQYDHPVASDGWLDILDENEGTRQRVRIRRAHLEEDTAKLMHKGNFALIDFNRAGVPLLEIVSEPDMHSVQAILSYANKIRAILRYLGVNSGDMEKGVLRFEANISVRPLGSQELNTRTEIKNLNSFRSLTQASSYEINRQIDLYNNGLDVNLETLGWDEVKGETYSQRGKEEAHDYRYFPEPDIPPILVDRSWVQTISSQLPELPDAKNKRFMEEYGLSLQEVRSLTYEKEFADFFEKVVTLSSSPTKMIYNWLTGEFTRQINERNIDIQKIPVTPENFAQLLDLFSSRVINDFTAKEILVEIFISNKNVRDIISEKGLLQISDENYLTDLINRILSENPDPVKQYLAGKESLFQWFMGQVSRETKGKSDPQVVRQLLQKILKNNN
ncbi:MAG: glutaminyl-tRNA synthase (glutamine-hydrolyzing) subunit B [Chloroflexi bacterium GWB2_49_20]|nr:MAG: glutaminyl-tRNA synthase (glutamine-hydrolyzing) subunit B [Chloroflexi bacterium GWB2_49_20]OGN78275.1 MAG: glutaminyl-tRNA synthase (glutamine-hydrolyzing) subunit B [Chloroflexi bacterium GWC2_49_37]OGN85311.1 MAG: glutaminyl-tRNA synthase (glutamine-hydrolyzing) subunit B [Chloroflexi bacterium GWD2_49_16]